MGLRFERILDLASGPYSLPWALGTVTKHSRRRRFDCLDLAPAMHECGRQLFAADGIKPLPRSIIGSMTDIPHVLGLQDPVAPHEEYDLAHCGLGIYYAQLKHKRKRIVDANGMILDERIRVLYGINQCARMLYFTLPERGCKPEELEDFCLNGLPLVGFRALDGFWGYTQSTDRGPQGKFTAITIAAERFEKLSHPCQLQERLGNGQLCHFQLSKVPTTNTSSGEYRKHGPNVPLEGPDDDILHRQFQIVPVSQGVRGQPVLNIRHDERRQREREKEVINRLALELNGLLQQHGLVNNRRFADFILHTDVSDLPYRSFLIELAKRGVRIQRGLINRKGKPFFILDDGSDPLTTATRELLNIDDTVRAYTMESASAESAEFGT